jgi:hypothetical protein
MFKIFILCALMLAGDKAAPGSTHTLVCGYGREVQMFVVGEFPASYDAQCLELSKSRAFLAENLFSI